jgi:two-component system CheB/CheR fusion protein
LVPLTIEEQHLGVVITFVDVTRHRQLQQELQKAHRELEVAYEELQSTNEELETMNEELSSTNEELQATNDELRDRTAEVNQVNAYVESVLATLEASVIVVDRSDSPSSGPTGAVPVGEERLGPAVHEVLVERHGEHVVAERIYG